MSIAALSTPRVIAVPATFPVSIAALAAALAAVLAAVLAAARCEAGDGAETPPATL